ncbi:hypothetical protein O181_002183 [Austropuccinia psidii MF-1]|uniref:Glutamate--cysteine ligase n=1 Tax=Austropuccinia psidii MF-1 TaxID=1389203 RepID=A0A9Q3BBZ6_9BASI|nr:hypothetical protein [Austropuccinia psidii MF-1]
MGLLPNGNLLNWMETKKSANKVRQIGVEQFLKLFNQFKFTSHDPNLWGDEIEYHLVSLDHASRRAKLLLNQSDVLQRLDHSRSNLSSSLDSAFPNFHAEYGSFMVEATPGLPYRFSLENCLKVQSNMNHRRQLIREVLKDNQLPITLTSFPSLGAVGLFIEPHYPRIDQFGQSIYLSDQIISQHARFHTLTSNIRERRGSKVAIFLPIYQDMFTPRPFKDPTIPIDPPKITHSNNLSSQLNSNDPQTIEIPIIPDNHIYLDAMGFGMGCCCLQVTFQAKSIHQARRLYDALIPVAPIMLALSAAAPVFKGFLTDVDSRWDVIAGAVDDRTDLEKSAHSNDPLFVPKSRFDSVSLYIADDPLNLPHYNDILAPVDHSIQTQLITHGVDPILARHIAHILIRDPLVVYSDSFEPTSIENTIDYFENLQSTNWQSVRFKPPPLNSSTIGWRVEFRTMEIQITDFENAAYSIFVALLVRTILFFDLNFYIPISKVDENMHRAQQRNSYRNNKFYFRSQVLPEKSGSTSQPYPEPIQQLINNPVKFEEMSLDEIMHGHSSSQFPGLMTLVKAYIDSLNPEKEIREKIYVYLDLISGRASGRLLTLASFIREFIQDHPKYQFDSIVSQEINYDLVCKLDEIEKGKCKVKELLGENYLQSL